MFMLIRTEFVGFLKGQAFEKPGHALLVSTMAGESRVSGRVFTGALAGTVAALCCAVLVHVASGMDGMGPTTALEANCGPVGCWVMGREEKAHKGLELHAAQQSLAHLHPGRRQQKRPITIHPHTPSPHARPPVR
jgi:hypothetical protein